MAVSLWWHYWTYQRRSTASTTIFCLANSTSHMASEIQSTAEHHHTCQAGCNLFKSTAHYLVQRQCNVVSLKDLFWGPLVFVIHCRLGCDRLCPRAYVALLCWRLAAVSLLSSRSDLSAAGRHDWVNYGHRLMDEVEQVVCDWILQRQRFCGSQHCVDFIVSKIVNSSLATLLSCLPPSQEISGWWWIRTFLWRPASISWFSLFIATDSIDSTITHFQHPQEANL